MSEKLDVVWVLWRAGVPISVHQHEPQSEYYHLKDDDVVLPYVRLDAVLDELQTWNSGENSAAAIVMRKLRAMADATQRNGEAP